MRRKGFYVILPIIALVMAAALIAYGSFRSPAVITYDKARSTSLVGNQNLLLHVASPATPASLGSSAVNSSAAGTSESNTQNPQQPTETSVDPAPSQSVPVQPPIVPTPVPSPAPVYPCQYGATTTATKCPTCPPCGGYGNGGRLCPMVAGGTPTYMCAVPCGYASTDTQIACRE